MINDFELIKPPFVKCKHCGKIVERGIVNLGRHSTECKKNPNTFTINFDMSWREAIEQLLEYEPAFKREYRLVMDPNSPRWVKVLRFFGIKRWTKYYYKVEKI